MTIKPDKIAHDIAKKAAELQIRRAAKYRVEAEELKHSAECHGSQGLKFRAEQTLVRADRAELLAREWTEKARCALDPVGYHTEKLHNESGLATANIEWAKIEVEIKSREAARLLHERLLKEDNGYAPEA